MAGYGIANSVLELAIPYLAIPCPECTESVHSGQGPSVTCACRFFFFFWCSLHNPAPYTCDSIKKSFFHTKIEHILYYTGHKKYNIHLAWTLA